MLYLAGQSYFRQMPDITRDQAVTGKQPAPSPNWSSVSRNPNMYRMRNASF
jgi:hypothetical protein